MKADNKFFMAAVGLRDAEKFVTEARQDLEETRPQNHAAEVKVRLAIQRLTDVLGELYRHKG